MCGVIAVIHADSTSISAAADVHDALYLLQHRGQDACGIATCASRGRIYQCKGNGMASKVFHDGDRVVDLPGFMGLGHLRYPTAGTSANSEAQPFYVNSPYGIAFAHNGNLTNAPELREFLDQEAHRHINTSSDSEILLNIFAHELNKTGKARVNPDDCFAALERTYALVQGGFACVALIAGFGLIAFRDSYGIRPLVLGSRTVDDQGTDYMVASETVALNFFGSTANEISDILPGQAVIVQKGQKPRFHQAAPPKAYAPDVFEMFYLARPDSMIDGMSVLRARRNMGVRLAKTIAKTLGPKGLDEIDSVMAIPETSVSAARVVAKELDKEFVDGFIKNRYVFRTFIMPDQKLRRTGIRRKLNAIQEEFQGRNILLIDDSIVRGTTSKEIVQMAREAGAGRVIFASCAPPIIYPHIYGIDLAQKHDLIAFRKSPEEVAHAIGADAVVFQTLPDLVDACIESSSTHAVKDLEVGVFSGKYITPIKDGYLEHLDRIRGDQKKMKIQEKARKAIVNGVAGEEDMKAIVNGRDHADVEGQQAVLQDISLHNLNDHET
ncbi:MAG: amidophosphoribosyltransferase [Piccolia ochrophora]|nr:MAG: amidophosphoribosyltransferase [Piccolia ochrophora]